jgi:catechol 2,3-dioxygenase-like lactoylglutathione lyase family enzyme
LEFFHHSKPAQRPRRCDWRPNDHGWVRLGIAVGYFDACLTVLGEHDIALLAPVTARNGLRRAAFRDPWIGAIVEVMEDGKDLVGYANRQPSEQPAVVYATSSVSDLHAAKHLYGDILGFELAPIDDLHSTQHEALWGLVGARHEGFHVNAGDMLLEIVCYRDPPGRPRPSDYRCSDQGIVNVAFGSHDIAEVEATFRRLAAKGLTPPHLVRQDGVIAGYITEPGHEIELVGLHEDALPHLGFFPAEPFFS